MVIQKRDLVRVFVKGGIISPGDLLKIIETAKEFGTDYVHFGSRQDVLFPVSKKNKEKLNQTFSSIQTEYDVDGEEYQNVVSSYVAHDVMPKTSWLAPHIYHYVLDTFKHRPKFKINIVDPAQSLVPLFTGNINFIASSSDNYWFLYLRFSEISEKPFGLPILIYGFDLAKVSKAIEDMKPLENNMSYEDIYKKLLVDVPINTQPIEHDLIFPDGNFPYYEGMNREAADKYWLGLYWRDNHFNIKFLRELCNLCLDTKIGKISLTPWKSFIVHGILEKDKLSWEKLMGKFGINMRHSALELNWHLPVLDEEALELKNFLVRALDQQDISTYGLTFTVKTSRKLVLFTSVVIEKSEKVEEHEPDTYNILYSKDFNPNLTEYFYYAKKVTKEILPPLLIELSHMYYDQLDVNFKKEQKKELERKKSSSYSMYQCGNCMTVYDEQYGEEAAGIESGVSFDDLPETYSCPLCGNEKSNFVKIS
ncbi:MAG: rubredoxin [Flammeovirgaceae bacterium]|nr:rubredoxin [Flammeovirgaceae bacterium]